MSCTRMLMCIAGACLALIGLTMLAGGTWLVLLGGSGFYVVAGLLLAAVATGLWRQRSYAFGVAVALLVLSMAWAWREVGLDTGSGYRASRCFWS